MGYSEQVEFITSGLIIPATILSIGVALLFMRTNYRFRRREGAMLISLYLVFQLLALQRNGSSWPREH